MPSIWTHLQEQPYDQTPIVDPLDVAREEGRQEERKAIVKLLDYLLEQYLLDEPPISKTELLRGLRDTIKLSDVA